MSTKAFFSEINYLRGFAILAVISIHVSAYYTQMPSINALTIFYILIGSFSGFAVPAFIFISGFVLYNKYRTINSSIEFYRKRFSIMIPQYVIISTLHLILVFFAAKVIDHTVDFSPYAIILKYATGKAFYHLWFFVLIIQLYILYPYILDLYTTSKIKNQTIHVLLTTSVLVIVYRSFLESITYIGNILLFCGYLFFFIFGMYVRDYYNLIEPKLVRKENTIFMLGTYIISSSIYASYTIKSYNSYGINNPDHTILILVNIYGLILSTIGIIALLNFSTYLSVKKPLRCMSYIGNNSFAIYIVHATILCAIVIFFSKLGFNWENILFYPAIFILTIILSVICIECIKKLPKNEYLIGKVNKEYQFHESISSLE